MFSLLKPAFSLLLRPRVLAGHASTYNRTLPYQVHIMHFHRFGSVFEPRTFSAHILLTSELLRTLSMVAASKPTSWLSMKIHLVNHLTHI
jgi:hypothetical protein